MELTSDNLLLYATTHYWSIHYTTKEFLSDLRKIYLVKTLIKKYIKKGILRERLILNYLILVFNVFDKEAAQKLLFFTVEKSGYSVLKTFLLYMNQLPDTILIGNELINLKEIPVDMDIVNLLRTL